MSWLLFAFSLTLLMLAMLSVLSVGGNCAVGGPYQIAAECPNGALLAPVAILLGLVAVVLGVFLGQGFGAQLGPLAMPILFTSLGCLFLLAFSQHGDITALIIGVAFELFGGLPLLASLLTGGRRMFVGAVTVGGAPFYDPKPDRKPLRGITLEPTEATVPAGGGHWTLSLLILAVACTAGYYLAQLLFATL